MDYDISATFFSSVLHHVQCYIVFRIFDSVHNLLHLNRFWPHFGLEDNTTTLHVDMQSLLKSIQKKLR